MTNFRIDLPVYPLIVFLFVIIIAFAGGAAFAWPVYRIITLFSPITLAESAILSTQICGLATSLVYLKYTDSLTFSALGFRRHGSKSMSPLWRGFLTGLIIVFLLGIILSLSGVYRLHPERDYSIIPIILLLAGAVATGFAVSLFEETVFRGGLLQGLRQKTNPHIAVIATSLVYAAVHFINYPEPSPGEEINGLTAVSWLIPAYSDLVAPGTFDAFVSLFILGALLGIVRIHTQSILPCIALHAGLVAGVKLFRYFLEYRPGGSYDFLVSGLDHRLGWLAAGLLTLATGFYYSHYCKSRGLEE